MGRCVPASVGGMGPELPELPETTAAVAPVRTGTVVPAEATHNPAEDTSSVRHKGFLIGMTVFIAVLPLALALFNIAWIGPAFTNDGFSRNWVQHDMKDFLNDSDIVERSAILHKGDFLNGYYFIVDATLVPGVTDEEVCQLLVEADQRFGEQTERGIGLDTIYVHLHGDIPSLDEALQTTIPFNKYHQDGFTIYNGKGVCARTFRSGYGG